MNPLPRASNDPNATRLTRQEAFEQTRRAFASRLVIGDELAAADIGLDDQEKALLGTRMAMAEVAGQDNVVSVAVTLPAELRIELVRHRVNALKNILKQHLQAQRAAGGDSPRTRLDQMLLDVLEARESVSEQIAKLEAARDLDHTGG